MPAPYRRICLGLCLTLILAASPVCLALTFQYCEDFSRTSYKDPLHTSAWWDTVAAEIKLFPLDVTQTGSCNTPDSAYDVALAGGYAFVADNTGGLQVVDISVAAQPVLAGNLATAGSARGVVVSGPTAYVAVGHSGLQVIDVSTPATPALLGGCGTSGFAHDVAISGPYAYVAQSGFGLQVVDISDPGAPRPVGQVDTDDWALGIAVSEPYAFIADGNGGLQVIDIADPTEPFIAASFATSGYARGLTVTGAHAVLAAGAAGLEIIDVSTPTAPVSLATVPLAEDARRTAVRNDYALVAAGGAGLQVVDISQPSRPLLLGGIQTGGGGYGVASDQDWVFLADGSYGLQVIELDPDGLNGAANAVRSLPIDVSEDPIVRARLTSIQVDSIRWELSADGGENWEAVAPGQQWHTFSHAGPALLWRSTHVIVGDANPACSSLTIEWQKLQSFPEIQSIQDVPDDEGRQVRVAWTSSRFDTTGSATPITEYIVFRRIDNGAKGAQEADTATLQAAAAKAAGPPATPEVCYPPGDWDYVVSVPADCELEYATVVPTLADTTATGGIRWTTFFVRARTATPGLYFDSPPDSGASIDNTRPAIPTGFSVAYRTGEGNRLTWDPCADPDFFCFRIYRAGEADFAPAPENLLHTTTGTEWLDEAADGWGHHYKLAIVNEAGRQSLAVAPATVTAVPPNAAGRLCRLHPNVPNPFNPVTRLSYELLRPGPVSLRIYDLAGRQVRTWVSGSQTAGVHSVVFDARDRRGRPLASGTYLAILRTQSGSDRLKMTIVK